MEETKGTFERNGRRGIASDSPGGTGEAAMVSDGARESKSRARRGGDSPSPVPTRHSSTGRVHPNNFLPSDLLAARWRLTLRSEAPARATTGRASYQIRIVIEIATRSTPVAARSVFRSSLPTPIQACGRAVTHSSGGMSTSCIELPLRIGQTLGLCASTAS